MASKANSAGTWCAGAAYFYTLDLDAQGLAWEYLRRHPQYQSEWSSAVARAGPERWGLLER